MKAMKRLIGFAVVGLALGAGAWAAAPPGPGDANPKTGQVPTFYKDALRIFQ